VISFQLKELEAIQKQVEASLRRTQLLHIGQIPAVATYTGSPAMNLAFGVHQSLWASQPGCGLKACEYLGKNIGWVTDHFRQQTDCLDDQERDNQHSFDSINSDAPRCEDLSTMMADTRPQDTIHNFMYTDPVTAAEATMPLQALIAAFSTDDAAPLAISNDWAKVSTRLSSIMDQLDAAGRQLSATTVGTSFDMAREAIDSVVRTGRIVAVNAQIMSATVAQFPTIRTANLAALHAIEASTATITDPAAKLAAEQSAVATFVSTQLQPSLELVRPPIMNLGVPIVGHTGGGVLTTSTVGQGSTVTPISQITGLTTTVASTATHAFGQAADAAAGSAGRGNDAAVAASVGIYMFGSQTLTRAQNSSGEASGEAASLDMEQVNQKLGVILDLINEVYLFDTDPSLEEAGIYKGLMYSLGDLYADYYTPEEMQPCRSRPQANTAESEP